MLQKFIISAFLLALSAMIVCGQSDFNKVEVFGGYSNSQLETGNSRRNSSSNSNNFQDFFNSRESFNGFEVSGTGNFNRYFGAKADFSGAYKNFRINPTGTSNGANYRVRNSVYNVLGGIQIKDNAADGSRIRPFGHALVGVAHGRSKVENNFLTSAFCTRVGANCNGNLVVSDTGFAAAVGGGLDIRINRRFGVRAFQIDYNPTHLSGSTQDNVRFSTGITFH